MKRFAHRSTAHRSTAALLTTLAVLSAACSNDPLAPRQVTAARAPNAVGPVYSSGYMVAWGKDGSANPGSSTTNGSGYMVGWGKNGANTGASTTGSGYMVGWGKDGNTAPQSSVNSGYMVGWGKDGAQH